MESIGISVIITAHNEGHELRDTLCSVIDCTGLLKEVIVVDDGSDDGSCDGISMDRVRILRHDSRIGVGYSRDEGSRAATGDFLCYLDGHQRVGKGCLDRCAKMANDFNAITCPDIQNYGRFAGKLHGASFRLCSKRSFFSASWRQWPSLRRTTTVTGLRAPPYLIPRELYAKVAWSKSLRGWGASDASVAVKAFFTNIRILHISKALARHRFQKKFPYTTTWDEVWRNHAIIARVCFDDSTWFQYWLPQIFEPHLTEEARHTLESSQIQAEHEQFLRRKVRTDRQFWTDLLRTSPPPGVD